MRLKKQEKKLNRAKEVFLNPVAFFRFITDFEPTDYQRKILLDENQYVTIRASRQSGKTEVLAAKVLWKSLLNKRFQTLIIAPTQRQSSIVFNKIDMYLVRNDFLNELTGYHSKSYVQFDNGSEIYNLPGSSGETVRGYSPNMIVVDEAAYVKDEVYTAIEPSLAATGGSMILISSPFGKQGRFYDSHARLDYYSRYHISYTECPFLKKDYIERERQNKTEMEFQQEYAAEFVEETDTFFPISLIKDRFAEIPWEEKPPEPAYKREGWDYYLGVDQARHGTDETVYFVSKYRENEPIKAGVYFEATSKKPLTDVMGRVQALHNKFDFKRIYMDTTGLGAGPGDYLKEKDLPIEQVEFTQRNKQDMYNNLKLLMEKKQIEIPDEQRLVWQLAEMQYVYSSNGLMKIHHPDKANAHDDWPDALALSVKFMLGGQFMVLDKLGELFDQDL